MWMSVKPVWLRSHQQRGAPLRPSSILSYHFRRVNPHIFLGAESTGAPVSSWCDVLRVICLAGRHHSCLYQKGAGSQLRNASLL